jgi:outer membrane protein OmpA-like peptidoglycan-associated protein
LAAAPTLADEDSSTLTEFSGAKALQHSVHPLEAYWIPLGKLFGDGQAEKVQVVEGKWTHVTYSYPNTSSVIEIARRYDEQLRAAGYEIVYDCRGAECGVGGRKSNGDWWDPNVERRYLVGRKERPAGDLWACVHVQGRTAKLPGSFDVDLVEGKPDVREQKMARDETDPAWLEQELSQSGHVAIFGIAFDDKSSALRPGAEATLRALSQVLSRDPGRRLLLVVHTDDVSRWKAGVQTSRKQAASLIAALIKRYGVSPARVAGEGVGPLAPMAAAASTKEPAHDRRVEVLLWAPSGSVLKAQSGQE